MAVARPLLAALRAAPKSIAPLSSLRSVSFTSVRASQQASSLSHTRAAASAFSMPVRRWFSGETAAGEKPAEPGAQAGQAPGPDAALPEKVADLEVQLAELKNERLRLLAEMENVRMIARRDVDTTRTYAIQSFAKSLLDVADTLSMAVDSVKPEALEDPAAKELRTLHEGVSMTRHSLMKLFANNGITQFGVAGEKFDPNRHEAMFEAHHDDYDHGHISTVIKTGFLLKDRILRPAKVGYVKKAVPPTPPPA